MSDGGGGDADPAAGGSGLIGLADRDAALGRWGQRQATATARAGSPREDGGEGMRMKAVVYQDTRRVEVRQVPDAQIEEPGDVVVRVTSSAICGTDLHMYDGRTGAQPGLVLGHEPLGTIAAVGGAVTLRKPGERVVVPTHLFCGLCCNCVRGYTEGMMAADREDARPSRRDPGSQHTEDSMTQTAPDPVVEAILKDDLEHTGAIEYHREAAGQ
jgi:hypothetical protein